MPATSCFTFDWIKDLDSVEMKLKTFFCRSSCRRENEVIDEPIFERNGLIQHLQE